MTLDQALILFKETALPHNLVLNFNGQAFCINSNSAELITKLKPYFKEWISTKKEENVRHINALEWDAPEFPNTFLPYIENGKKRSKEVYFDENGYRVIKKVKTGLHFIVKGDAYFALGPVTQRANQLVNFANCIYMETLLQANANLFHAAGVAQNGVGIVMAAQSGKGKSTTALNLLNNGLDFISNDRVVLLKNEDKYTMYGVPKHPRVNPGTLLNNSKIKHLLHKPERFEGLSTQEIWNWEEKYDVPVDEIYGENKFKLEAKAKALLIIDWENNTEPLKLEQVNLNTRLDLLPAIMKAPSILTPKIHDEKANTSAQDYLDFLSDLPVYILSGGINPEKAIALIKEQLIKSWQ